MAKGNFYTSLRRHAQALMMQSGREPLLTRPVGLRKTMDREHLRRQHSTTGCLELQIHDQKLQ